MDVTQTPANSPEDPFEDDGNIKSQWEEFYTRARAIRNKDSHLKKRAKEEPADLFHPSPTTLNAIDETFKKIEKEEPYNVPEDRDPKLWRACRALSHALQEASIAKAQ